MLRPGRTLTVCLAEVFAIGSFCLVCLLSQLVTSVLAAFAHRLQGSGPATGVVRGLLLGLFAFSSFFLVLALLLPHGVVLAFACAVVVALVVHGASLVVGRRLSLA